MAQSGAILGWIRLQGSPGLNGSSSPAGMLCSAIASIIAMVM
jgi:hypothetical protein